MRIEILLEDFCTSASYMEAYSRATIRRYQTNIRLFIRRSGVGDIELITKDVVRLFFMEGRSKYHWSPATFLTYYKSLKVFLRWCANQKHAKGNLVDDIEKPKLEKKLPSRLTQQEAMKLLEVVYNYPYDYPYLRYRNHAIVAMFIFAGLRKSELLNLKVIDVNLEDRSVFIRLGKGNKDRIVPMCPRLAQILRRYLEERRRLKKVCSEFFASLQGSRGLTADGLKSLLRMASHALGLKFSAHKLRHTFATLMLEGGCDIYSLSKLMGHSDIKTTTIYLAASLEHLRGQITKHPLNDV